MSVAESAGASRAGAALHSLDSYDVVYDGQDHDDTKSVSHLDWPFLIKVSLFSEFAFCEVSLNMLLHIHLHGLFLSLSPSRCSLSDSLSVRVKCISECFVCQQSS